MSQQIIDVDETTSALYGDEYYLLCNNERDPIIARMEDPSDKKEKHCLFVMTDKEHKSKILDGKFKNSDFVAERMDNSKMNGFVGLLRKHNLMALLCVEHNGEMLLQPLTKMVVVQKV